MFQPLSVRFVWLQIDLRKEGKQLVRGGGCYKDNRGNSQNQRVVQKKHTLEQP